MDYILVFLMSFFATVKMSFQSAFGKNSVKNSTDALCFNIFVFITGAILFSPKIFGCSPAVWVYAAIGAVFTVAYQLFYTKALSVGNVSMTVLMVNFSMVLNVLASFLFFHDPISVIRLIAIGMTIVSFVICSGVGKAKVGEKKWLAFALLAMLFTSCGSIVQKFFGESSYGGESAAFVPCLYLMSAVVAVIVYPIMNKREKRSFKISFSSIKYAVAVGACLGIFQLLYTYGMSHIDGTFLFPAQTGGTIILSTITGVLVFKDKLRKKQIFGVILGLISLVLMNY